VLRETTDQREARLQRNRVRRSELRTRETREHWEEKLSRRQQLTATETSDDREERLDRREEFI